MKCIPSELLSHRTGILFVYRCVIEFHEFYPFLLYFVGLSFFFKYSCCGLSYRFSVCALLKKLVKNDFSLIPFPVSIYYVTSLRASSGLFYQTKVNNVAVRRNKIVDTWRMRRWRKKKCWKNYHTSNTVIKISHPKVWRVKARFIKPLKWRLYRGESLWSSLALPKKIKNKWEKKWIILVS